MSSKSNTLKRLTLQDRKMLDYEEPALSILAGQNPRAQEPVQKEKTLIESKNLVTVGSKNKVAIFSERNTTWPEVGKVYRGINFVAVELADKWLTRPSVRLATQKEIDKEFN